MSKDKFYPELTEPGKKEAGALIEQFIKEKYKNGESFLSRWRGTDLSHIENTFTFQMWKLGVNFKKMLRSYKEALGWKK